MYTIAKGDIENMFKNSIAWRIIITFISLIILYSLLLILAWSIPAGNAQKHLLESRDLIAKEGNYYRFFPLIGVAQTENWSDGYWWNMAYHADLHDNAIVSAFSANYYEVSYPTVYGVDNLSVILESRSQNIPIESLNIQENSYGRYWQGMTVILFPLLFFFNIIQIRIFFYIIMSALFTVFLYMIYKRLGKLYAGITLISLLLIHFYAIPVSAQYITCFSVMLIFSMVCLRNSLPKSEYLPLYFFIAGSVVNYLDFLTTPLITFSVPAVILATRYRKECPEYSAKKNTVFLIKNSICWCIGYFLTWITKWILTYAITGNPEYLTGIRSHISQRASLNQGIVKHTVDYVIAAGHNTLALCETPAILLITAIGIVLLYKVHQKYTLKQIFVMSLDYFWVFIVPYVWMILFAEHSRTHYHFVYRVLFGSVMAVFFALVNLVENNPNQID